MSKLNYRDPIWALLLIISVLFGAYQCESAKNAKLSANAERSRVEQAEAEKRARIAQEEATIDSIQKVRVKDSLRFQSILKPLLKSTDYWREKAQKVRPQVLVISDTIPALKDYITATDSVI